MHSGPAKTVETIVAWLVPPACREEIVGDLHERYRSPFHYVWEVVRTVPPVIVSRIRRTADPHVLLIQSLALYLSFVLATWLVDTTLLRNEWSLVRLGVLVVAIVLGMLLEDAYADPAGNRRWSHVRGPMLGFTLAWLLETLWRFGRSDLSVPLLIMLWGTAAGLPLFFCHTNPVSTTWESAQRSERPG
jgi:hypothetical protein